MEKPSKRKLELNQRNNKVHNTLSPMSLKELKSLSTQKTKKNSVIFGYRPERPSRIYDLNFLEKVKLGRENLLKIQKESITNHYEIIGELGSGSYGSVKKVRHKKLKEIRAMKVKMPKLKLI